MSVAGVRSRFSCSGVWLLASGEDIVVLVVCLSVYLSVCLSAEPRLHARRISLGGEGNALYPVLSSSIRREVQSKNNDNRVKAVAAARRKI